MKTLTCIAAFGAALVMAHSADAASALAKACAADIKAQCADVKPGGGKLKDCVKAHFSDLSADCQVASSVRLRSAGPARPTSRSFAPTSRRARVRLRTA